MQPLLEPEGCVNFHTTKKYPLQVQDASMPMITSVPSASCGHLGQSFTKPQIS